MNRTLVVLSVLAAGAFLIPDVAEAQRGGRGGGGARIGAGGFGGGARMGGGGFRGGSFGAGPRMYIPRGGVGGPRVGLNAWRGRGVAIAARPGWGGMYAPRAIYRGGYGRYGWRAPYYGRVAGAYRPYLSRLLWPRLALSILWWSGGGRVDQRFNPWSPELSLFLWLSL